LKLAFTKMHGAGNDFVVVESGSAVTDWNRLAIAMCDRHYGVGADGLLLVSPSRVADLGMRIFNADGSEANMCGNGLRCVVTHHVDTHRMRANECPVTVETRSGVRDAWFRRTAGKMALVRVGMGAPRFGVGDAGAPGSDRGQVYITLADSCGGFAKGTRLELDLVSLGNSHAVLFTNDVVSGFPLDGIGAVVERDVPVSGGINFEVARVVDRRRIEARVLEHGVGETLACGSGACAIAVAAARRGFADGEVRVSLPGGELSVVCNGSSEVFLTGPAETVFHGEWPSRDEGLVPRCIKNEVLA
jgi:diaminopimelate epimerase